MKKTVYTMLLLFVLLLFASGCVSSNSKVRPGNTSVVSNESTGAVNDSDLENRLRSIGYLG